MTNPQTWDDGAQIRMNNIYARANMLQRSGRVIDVAHEIEMVHDWLVDIVFAEDFDAARSGPDLLEHWEHFGALGLIGRRTLGLEDDLVGIVEFVANKQRDYGPKNIARFGNHGLVIRAYDKVARFQNLWADNGAAQAYNEPIEDTLLDFIGYAIVAMLWNSETDGGAPWFLLPMAARA